MTASNEEPDELTDNADAEPDADDVADTESSKSKEPALADSYEPSDDTQDTTETKDADSDTQNTGTIRFNFTYGEDYFENRSFVDTLSVKEVPVVIKKANADEYAVFDENGTFERFTYRTEGYIYPSAAGIELKGLPAGEYEFYLRSETDDGHVINGNRYLILRDDTFTVDDEDKEVTIKYLKVSQDMYFYYKDTSGKVPSISWYFGGENNKGRKLTKIRGYAATFKVSETKDGDAVYTFDPDGSIDAVTIKSGVRTIVKDIPYLNQIDYCYDYSPSDWSRISKWESTTWVTEAEVPTLRAGSSWGPSSDKYRGVLLTSSEDYNVFKFRKQGLKYQSSAETIEAKFYLSDTDKPSAGTDNKKYVLTHYDTYEYEGTTYENVYIPKNVELKPGEYKGDDSVINTQDGEFTLLLPAGWYGTTGDIVNMYFYLHEISASNGYYSQNRYAVKQWSSSYTTSDFEIKYNDQPIKATFLEGQSAAGDVRTFSVDDVTTSYNHNNDVSTQDIANLKIPSITKQMADPAFEDISDIKFNFDIYVDENGSKKKIATVPVENGETVELDPETIEGLTYDHLRGAIYIKEQQMPGYTVRNVEGAGSYDGEYYTYRQNGNTTNPQNTNIKFINKRDVRSVVVLKNIVGVEAGKKEKTTFKVTIWDEIDGEKIPIKGYKTSVNNESKTTDDEGSFTFDLETTGTYTAGTGFPLPKACHYKIEELSCTADGAKCISKSNDTGVVQDNNPNSQWVNAVLHDLTITKEYDDSGTNAVWNNERYPFTFEVILTDIPASVSGFDISEAQIRYNSGDKFETASHIDVKYGNYIRFFVQLGIGDTFTIKDLPKEVGYQVREDPSTGSTKYFDITYTDSYGTTVKDDGSTGDYPYIKGKIGDDNADINVLNKLKTFDLKIRKKVHGYDDGRDFYFLYRAASSVWYKYSEDGTGLPTFVDRHGIERNFIYSNDYVYALIPFRPEDGEIVITLPQATHWFCDEMNTKPADDISYEELLQEVKDGKMAHLFHGNSPDLSGYKHIGWPITSGSNRDEDMLAYYENVSRMLTLDKVDQKGNPVSGAHLEIIDEETGEVLKEWVSDGKDPYLWLIGNADSCKIGDKWYSLVDRQLILRETQVPDGYFRAEDIRFTIKKIEVTSDELYTNGYEDLKHSGTDHYIAAVTEDGEETCNIQMVDRAITATVAKKDADGNNLAGAHLAVFKSSDVDADGNPLADKKPVYTFVSGEKPHEIFGKLGLGADYVLVETEAPDGYLIANPIPFTISEQGEVLVNKEKVDEIVMTDEKKAEESAKTDDESKTKKTSSSASTGDENNVALWSGLFAISAMALLFVLRRRKDRKQ